MDKIIQISTASAYESEILGTKGQTLGLGMSGNLYVLELKNDKKLKWKLIVKSPNPNE